MAVRVRNLLGEQAGTRAGVPTHDAVDPPVQSGARVGAPAQDAADLHMQDAPELPSASALDGLMSRLPMRLGTRRHAVLAVVLVALVIAVGGWLRAERPSGLPGPALPTASSAGAAPAEAAPTTNRAAAATARPSMVVVDVAGKVRRPGVYRLPAGSRVDDALRAAGGPRIGVNLNSLNLAAVVADGQQIAVGVRGAAAPVGVGVPAGTGATGGTGPGSGPIDLNAATLEQLETLPGVGPVLGQNILAWRAQHGRFSSVAQLDEVSGIGPARLAELRPLVTV